MASGTPDAVPDFGSVQDESQSPKTDDYTVCVQCYDDGSAQGTPFACASSADVIEPLHVIRLFHGDAGAVAFSPDSKLLAVCDETSRIWVVRCSDAAVLGELKGHDDRVTAVAFLPRGESLVSSALDKTLRCWDL